MGIIGRQASAFKIGGLMKKLALVFLLCLGPAAAWADAPPNSCRVYSGHEQGLPAAVETILREFRADAVEACSRIGVPDDTPGYSILSRPRNGASWESINISSGVCRFEKRRVFAKDAGWTTQGPYSGEYGSTYMAAADAPCPPAGDQRYVLTSRVSEGLFLAVSRFWAKLSTAKSLDGLIDDDWQKLLRLSPDFLDFEGAVQNGAATRGDIRISRIFLDESSETATFYGLDVTMPKSDNEWVLYVDLAERDLRLKLIGTAIR
jgi:hypothetical protein